MHVHHRSSRNLKPTTTANVSSVPGYQKKIIGSCPHRTWEHIMGATTYVCLFAGSIDIVRGKGPEGGRNWKQERFTDLRGALRLLHMELEIDLCAAISSGSKICWFLAVQLPWSGLTALNLLAAGLNLPGDVPDGRSPDTPFIPCTGGVLWVRLADTACHITLGPGPCGCFTVGAGSSPPWRIKRVEPNLPRQKEIELKRNPAGSASDCHQHCHRRTTKQGVAD